MSFHSSLPGPRSLEATRLICLEPLEPASGKPDASGLLELWRLLLDHKPAIVLFAVFGLAAALIVSMLQPPVYEARTTLEVQSLNEGGVEPLSIEAPGGGYAPETYLRTQARILESATLRGRVNRKVAAEYRPGAQPGDRFAAVRGALRLAAPAPAPGAAPPVHVTVRPYENTRLIEIRAEARDPQLAALFANTMGNEYIEYHLEARWNAAQRATQWLTMQLEKLKLKLRDSENKLHAYSRGAGLIFTGERTSVEQGKLEQLQTELTRAQAERVAFQSAYEIASKAPADTVPQVLDNGRLGGYQAQIADLRRQLAEMSSSLTPEHYRMLRVQAQIKTMEATLKRERDNILARIRNDYQTALRREGALRKAYENQARVVSDQAAKSVNYDILRREAESNRKLYDQLLEKVQGAGLVSAMKATNIRVVDAAEPPEGPSKPNLPYNLALGLAGGLLLGVVFVAAGERVNRSLKSPGETPYHLKVPELGVIPEKSSGPGGGADNLELVTWQDRPSLLAESFRSTLASILVAEQNGQRPHVILVTSPARGEGKSASVSNLGIALAEINQKVLLLDADMRKPHLHMVFNTPNSWGLSDLLRERRPLKDMPLEALARETEIAGLYLLPSGTGTVSIANLLYSNRTAELIDRLRAEFDMVLIDTPPMLYLSDARVLGRLADAAILVVRAGRTTRDAAMSAKQRLVDDRIPVLGTILNGWDPKAKTRYGYYAYAAGADGEG